MKNVYKKQIGKTNLNNFSYISDNIINLLVKMKFV